MLGFVQVGKKRVSRSFSCAKVKLNKKDKNNRTQTVTYIKSNSN